MDMTREQWLVYIGDYVREKKPTTHEGLRALTEALICIGCTARASSLKLGEGSIRTLVNAAYLAIDEKCKEIKETRN